MNKDRSVKKEFTEMQTLIGIKANNWFKLIKQNNFSIAPKYWIELLVLTILSLRNSIFSVKENKLYGQELKNVTIKDDPIFILGHWRSGTTLLHSLLTLDPQFAFPKIIQVYNPSCFLYVEPIIRKKLENISPQKRPMDNMEVTINDPAEEEFAISVLSLCSPLLAWNFPKKEEFYDRYLNLKDISP